MHLKITYKKVVLPVIVVLFTAVAVAQIATGGRWVKQLFTPAITKVENSEVTDDDKRPKTGDDPWTELEHIYKLLKGNTSIYYSGKIKLTDEDQTTTLEESDFSGEVNGNSYRYSIDSVDLIHTDQLSLNIYHREKMIIAGNEQKGSKNWWAYSNIDSLKSLAAHEGSTALVLLDKTDKVIKIENTGNPDIYGYEIFYNPADYKIKKMVLIMTTLDDLDLAETSSGDAENKKTDAVTDTDSTDVNATDSTGAPIEFNLYRMELQYNEFRVGEATKDLNPLKKFATVSKSGLTVNPAYSDYRVIWMDDKKRKK